MNERLEKEIQIYDAYLEANGLTASLSAIAEYFYNLALEDVEKFVESLTMNVHEMPDNYPDKKYCMGADDTVQQILCFIDDLTK